MQLGSGNTARQWYITYNLSLHESDVEYHLDQEIILEKISILKCSSYMVSGCLLFNPLKINSCRNRLYGLLLEVPSLGLAGFLPGCGQWPAELDWDQIRS
jgi:hypothetical protein